jgi:hypothetical protein
MITRKCLRCGSFTENSTVCKNCLSPFITEDKLKEEIKKDYDYRQQNSSEEFKFLIFVNKLTHHKFILVRVFGYLLKSIMLTIFFIVSLIAYLIALIAA